MQLKECAIELLFQLDVIGITMYEGLDTKHAWSCLYGYVVCIEMLIMSVIITWKGFPSKDLILWNKLDALSRQRGDSEISINLGVTVLSDTDESTVVNAECQTEN